jgi:tyrosine-protein phosphatase YwqE
MLSFCKKKVGRPSLLFSNIQTDFHSHLIPGVDDGSPNTETSIRYIKEMVALGFTKIITTPHIMSDFYPNTSEKLKEGFILLKKQLEEQQINVQFEVAAEYFLDEHFERLLDQNDILTFGDNYVLIEMSFIEPNRNLHQIMFNLITKGYKPIMAHPERYPYYVGRLDKLEEIIDMGCKLQVNLLSLTHYYGKAVNKLALQLFTKNMVDFVGSDLHHDRHLQAIQGLPVEIRNLIDKTPLLNNTL